MKKLVKINAENLQQLQGIISEAEGKAKIRTITAQQMVDACISVSGMLGISKKAMEGVIIDADLNAEKLPNAYKYAAMSTQFRAQYSGGSWRLLSVSRGYLRQRTTSNVFQLTDAAKAAIIEQAQNLLI